MNKAVEFMNKNILPDHDHLLIISEKDLGEDIHCALALVYSEEARDFITLWETVVSEDFAPHFSTTIRIETNDLEETLKTLHFVKSIH